MVSQTTIRSVPLFLPQIVPSLEAAILLADSCFPWREQLFKQQGKTTKKVGSGLNWPQSRPRLLGRCALQDSPAARKPVLMGHLTTA